MKGKREHEGRNVPNALNKGRTSVARKQLQPSWTAKQAIPQNHLKHSYFHRELVASVAALTFSAILEAISFTLVEEVFLRKIKLQ